MGYLKTGYEIEIANLQLFLMWWSWIVVVVDGNRESDYRYREYKYMRDEENI